jgi:hypothetical protein
MKVSERFRRFWLSSATEDRPLSEEERDWVHEHPANVYDELATTADQHAGGEAFDPDAGRGST